MENVAYKRNIRNALKIQSENLKGRKYLGDLDRREYNIKMNLKGIGCSSLDRVLLAQDRDQLPIFVKLRFS
jgi:hypothetical protein